MSTDSLTTNVLESMVIERNQKELERESNDLITEENPRYILIASLVPSSLILTCLLPVQITETIGGYIASFSEANIHSQGQTEWEAIDNLKLMIIDSFEMLSELDPSELGPVPTKQLAILQSFIQNI